MTTDPLVAAAIKRAKAVSDFAAVERRLASHRLRGPKLHRANVDFVHASERLHAANYNLATVLGET
jgi:hypothetical protein